MKHGFLFVKQTVTCSLSMILK